MMCRLPFALLSMLLVAACGGQAESDLPIGYDITRIHQVQNDFPPGYTVKPLPPLTLTQQEVDQLGGLSGSVLFTFEPSQCSTMLRPVAAMSGARSEGLDAQGPEPITVLAVQSPVPGPAQPNADCEHVTVSSPGVAEGTVDRIPGPTIDGVDTSGIKIHLTVTSGKASQSMDRYTFVATLSPTTAVVVQGDAGPDVLKDILTKSVAVLND